jgi:heptosyltransferase-2
MAGLLASDGVVSSELSHALAPFDAVIAYTASTDLLRGLAHAAPSAEIVAHSPQPPPAGPHAAASLAQAVARLGANPAVAPATCAASAAETAQAKPWLNRLGPCFLAIHPGSGAPRKNWPADRFAALAERLAGGRSFLLIEGPADGEAATAASSLPGAVHARDLPPRALGAVLAQAGVYVGNDSGVSHLAAAWGAPVLTLFGPTDPAQWAPIGPRVKVLRASGETMDRLELEDVERAARDVLDATSTETDRRD